MEKSMPVIQFFRYFFSLFVLAITVAIYQPAQAQTPIPSDDQVNAIARRLFCPICENTPLDVCPTQACHDWRELIRQMLAQGKTPDQIEQYFVDHYGARVLAEPPRAGLGWLVYIVPPTAFLIGVLLLFRAFRIWNQTQKEPAMGPGSGVDTAVEDEYASRLEEELRKRA